MCTVTYFPYQNNFILTSNRDEHYQRKPALLPGIYTMYNKEIIFPKDQEAGGTWIATTKSRVSTILNGAFKKHKHEPPYRKSRGLVLLDSFSFEKLEDFVRAYNFNNIEPFTFIAIERIKKITIHEIRWNGEKAFYKNLNAAQPHAWRSASLYDKEDQKNKEKKFRHFLAENKIDETKLLQFNLMKGNTMHDEDIILKRNKFGVETTATTQIKFENSIISMKFYDHQSNKNFCIEF